MIMILLEDGIWPSWSSYSFIQDALQFLAHYSEEIFFLFILATWFLSLQ